MHSIVSFIDSVGVRVNRNGWAVNRGRGNLLHLFCLSVVLLFGAMQVAAQEGDADQATMEPPVPQVDLNTADADALALALDGVGEARAMDIIAYREEHGPFTSVEQLQEVSGIGPATLERNRERLLISTQ